MYTVILLHILCFVFCRQSCVSAQSCVPSATVPEKCIPFIQYSYIYVPANSSFETLVNQSTLPLAILSALPAPCNTYLQRFICASLFQNCTLVNTTSGSIALASPVCSQMCQHVRDTCPTTVTSNVPPDCNSIPFSPTALSVVQVGNSTTANITVEIYCTDTSNITAGMYQIFDIVMCNLVLSFCLSSSSD